MLHLQDLAKQGEHTTKLAVNERLPSFITEPCQLEVTYSVVSEDDFYLIHLHVAGKITVDCQRCMQEFTIPYTNQTTVAVCRSDERAEQLLEHYECIVSANLQVDLAELIIDELHLYAPQFHTEISDCGTRINQILGEKNESY